MLKINNVTKSFAGALTPSLKEVNLCMSSGEFCILIGANGSGKSTLMKVINKECLPDSGSIELGSRIGYVVQDINQGTIPKLTLLENIALSYMRYKKPKLAFYSRYRAEIIAKIMGLNLGLKQYINQPLERLSGGQRQIIATLMAINTGSQILLLDEHTSALDPKMQSLLMEYTAAQITKQGLTAIMITHKMDDAIKYGNRLLMLHKGRIVLDIKGKDKKALKVRDLLKLFHQYEDQDLLSSGGNL